MNLFNGNTFTFLIKFFPHLLVTPIKLNWCSAGLHSYMYTTCSPNAQSNPARHRKVFISHFFRSVFSSCFLYKAIAVSRRVEVTEFANILQPNTIKYGKLNFYSLDLIHPRSALELRKGDSNRSNLNIALLASMLLCTHKL